MKNPFKKSPAFYDQLVVWEKISELLEHFEEHEQEEALQLVLEALDHAVLETILNELENDWHEAFLEEVKHRHHDAGLLSWLEERSLGITPKIRETIKITKLSFRETIIIETENNHA